MTKPGPRSDTRLPAALLTKRFDIPQEEFEDVLERRPNVWKILTAPQHEDAGP
jgi:hypothetical protein